MSIYSYRDIKPEIPDSCFVAESADVVGRVTVGANSSIWYSSVVRGDVDSINIGQNTNIQDLSILHVTGGIPLIIGSQVSIAHHVTLHSCTIGDNTLVGMGAVVLDNVVVGKNSVVAAGSILPPNKTYPAFSLIMGNPGVVKRALTEEEIESYSKHYLKYIDAKNEHLSDVVVKI